ncbi:MAG: tetratricopeptide repeat protein, partial [Nannocystaceae bacterium]
RFGSMSELVEAMLDDPSLRRGKRNRWLLGIGVVGASVGVAVAGRSPAAEPRDECGYGREHMAAVWNEAQAQQVQAGLRVESLPYAAHVAEGVGRGLEDYAKEWELAHRDACEATHVRNEQTGALLDKRMACLDRRLAALQASIELLARVEPEQVEHALGAVEGLGSIEGCADRTALEATGPPPPDAATAAAVAEIQAQLERAAALSRLRQYTRALEVMETLGPGVEALDYGPLSVELLYARGGARLEAGQLEAGIEDLRASLVRAQALAMDRQVRDSARDLSLALGTRLARPEEALPWADLAEATDERVGSTAASQAELLRARAWVLVEWGLRPEAIEIVGKAYEVGTQAYEPGSHELLSVYSSMGSVYARLGEFESAQGHFEHAVKAAEQYFGPDHPQLLTHYLNLGNVLSAQSKLEAAGRYLQRASDLAERIPGISGHERALVASAMGNLALNEKRFEDAVQHHQHALQLREQTYGLEHPLVGRSLNSLGSAASSLGRIDEAAAYFRRSLAIREQAMGEQHPSLIMVLGNLGVMLAEHHRFAEAVPYLERAHGLVQEHGDDPRREAQQRYWLGRSLAESGADYGRGRTLVEQALERAIAAGKDDTVDDARQWLSTHPERPG